MIDNDGLISNIFNNNIIMNKNAKLLPHLNQLFMQRQSYTSHRKKITEIKNKKPKLKIKQQLSKSRQRQSALQQQSNESTFEQKSRTYKNRVSQIPPTIMEKYKSLGNSFDWMNPYRKKKHIQQIKQNFRNKTRIQSSKSQLQKGKLQKQYVKFAKIKQRLMKYQINPESHKAILKSRKSLDLLSPTSRVSNVSQKNVNFYTETKRGSGNPIIRANHICSRKQSNFSAFVKRTYEMKQETENKKSLLLSKVRAQINYTKMQKNMEHYQRKYKRIKTQFSSQTPKLQKIKVQNNIVRKSFNSSANYRYFALTEPDI